MNRKHFIHHQSEDDEGGIEVDLLMRISKSTLFLNQKSKLIDLEVIDVQRLMYLIYTLLRLKNFDVINSILDNFLFIEKKKVRKEKNNIDYFSYEQLYKIEKTIAHYWMIQVEKPILFESFGQLKKAIETFGPFFRSIIIDKNKGMLMRTKNEDYSILKQLPFLKSVCFRNCDITDNTLEQLIELQLLTELIIDNCYQLSTKGYLHIMQMKSLENLSISKTRQLRHQQVLKFFKHTSLKKIALDDCKPLSLDVFCSINEENSNLEEISINNCISPLWSKKEQFDKGIQHLKKMRSLSLSGGYVLARYFFDALNNMNIEKLFLKGVYFLDGAYDFVSSMSADTNIIESWSIDGDNVYQLFSLQEE